MSPLSLHRWSLSVEGLLSTGPTPSSFHPVGQLGRGGAQEESWTGRCSDREMSSLLQVTSRDALRRPNQVRIGSISVLKTFKPIDWNCIYSNYNLYTQRGLIVKGLIRAR